MKTEKEVRELLDSIRQIARESCDCAKLGPVHSMQCQLGAAIMLIQVDTLAYILDLPTKNPNFPDRMGRLIEHAAAERVRAREAKKKGDKQ